MKKRSFVLRGLCSIIALAFFFALSTTTFAEDKKMNAEITSVVVTTTLGNFTIALDQEKAPESVKNFLSYVDDKFYDGLVFHRVIDGFMIQGGGMDTNLKEKANKAPIKNEASNGLKNARGTLAMARTNNPNSATSQFFVNLVDNGFLDYNATQAGYAVFGKVTEGMDVVDKIAKVKVTTKGMYENVPAEPVVISSIKRK